MNAWRIAVFVYSLWQMMGHCVTDRTHYCEWRSRQRTINLVFYDCILWVVKLLLWIMPGISQAGKYIAWDIQCQSFNSLAPGRFECNSKSVIFTLFLLIGIFRSYNDKAISWMAEDFTDDKSTLVQVMAWCRRSKSYYLSQCRPRAISPYRVIRP